MMDNSTLREDLPAEPGAGAGANFQRLRTVWRIFRVFALGYLIVLLAMTWFETALVYPIPPMGRFNWRPIGVEFEDVNFTSADGTKLHGWFFPNEGAKQAILYFHGNGECVANNVELMDHLRRELNAAVFIFDYRGYGNSEGRPHEAGLIADGLAAQQWLAERMGIQRDDVVLFGRSIGGAVAIGVAAEVGAKALVLENTFSRLTDVAAGHFRWLPVRLLMKNRFDSLERINRYEGPVFQTHASIDEVVPLRFGQRLHEAIRSGQKRFVEFADCYHNDPPPAEYYDQLAEFLDQISPPTAE
jgi:fermentation-respiration switch protein FrsA (DUF1100 family)